jgi:DNA-binding NtrC family response regulator
MRSTPPKRILVIEDDLSVLGFLLNLFRTEGWDVHEASSGSEGIEKLEKERFDVILTDLRLPGADGIEVLRTAKKIQSDAEVVLMTGYGTVDSAIEAMRAGAFHFLKKPFRAEEVSHLVDKAYDRRQLTRENLFLRAEARGKYQAQSVVGTSPAILESLSRVQQLADTETPVLFEGERGTGRGFFARILHYQSARSGGLFVPVTCDGIPEELESEPLDMQGAYQRAMLLRAGKAELASRGTLYLADIEKGRGSRRRSSAPDGENCIPVGSDRHEVDVRLVASSHLRHRRTGGEGEIPSSPGRPAAGAHPPRGTRRGHSVAPPSLSLRIEPAERNRSKA